MFEVPMRGSRATGSPTVSVGSRRLGVRGSPTRSPLGRDGAHLHGGDGEEVLSPVGSPNRSDLVLVRCRDTIERLHHDVNEEQKHRKELHHRCTALESDLQTARTELDREKGVRTDLEARTARLERQLADCEAKLQTQKKTAETLSEQLQKAKVDAVQKAQELFAKGLKVTELEGTLKRAEAQVATAQGDATRADRETREVGDRIVSLEAEIAQLRTASEAEAMRAQRAARLADERERKCDELQKELDETQATAKVAEETLRQQLAETRKQHERAVLAWRERESTRDAEHARQVADRAAEADHSSAALESRAEQLKDELADFRRRLSDAEANSAKSERRAEQLHNELSATKIELQGRLHSAEAEHGRDHTRILEEMAARSADLASARTEAEASQQQASRLAEERRSLQEKWFALNAETTKLHHQVETLQQELVERQQQVADRGEELHKQNCREAAMVAKCELQARTDLAELRDRAESEVHRAALELTEERGRHSLLEERCVEVQRNQKRTQDSYTELNAQVVELTWRLETTNGELDRNKSALRAEQERALRAEAAMQQLRDGWFHSEAEMRRSGEQVWRRGHEDAQRSQELLRRSHEELRHASEEVRQSREHVHERDGALKRTNEMLQKREEQLRHVERQVERIGDELNRTQALAVESKYHAREEADMQAACVAREAQRDAQRDVADARQEAAEAMARVSAAQAHTVTVEMEGQQRAAFLESECQARTEQLAEARMRLCRMEAEATVAVHNAETSSTWKGREAEAMTERRLERAERRAAERGELRAEQLAEDRFEQKVEKLRRRYEEKIASLYQRLSDREAYERHLKSLIQNEVDVLHQYNRELDHHGHRMQQFETEALQDVVAHRMRGLADKVERRILRGLRHKEAGDLTARRRG